MLHKLLSVVLSNIMFGVSLCEYGKNPFGLQSYSVFLGQTNRLSDSYNQTKRRYHSPFRPNDFSDKFAEKKATSDHLWHNLTSAGTRGEPPSQRPWDPSGPRWATVFQYNTRESDYIREITTSTSPKPTPTPAPPGRPYPTAPSPQKMPTVDQCYKPMSASCHISKYRTIDGSCNNLAQPDRGKSFIGFGRFIPPDYGDGVSSPRKGHKRGLPNARLVSTKLHPDQSLPHLYVTALFVPFSQLLNHDMTNQAPTLRANGTRLDCCNLPERDTNPACLPIIVPPNDYFYSRLGITCLNFVRTLFAPRCESMPTTQLNRNTAWIDASPVYGSTEERANLLRTFRDGQLASSLVSGFNFLPLDTNRSSTCTIPKNRKQCFLAGDFRVNQQLSLTTVHALLMTEHNRIAVELGYLNPEWTDEVKYQEARRIFIAIYQRIVYRELLPIILGPELVNKYGLGLQRKGYSKQYDSQINADILSSFATACYRLHSLIPGLIDLRSDDGKKVGGIPVSQTFNNPVDVYRKGVFTATVNGFAVGASESSDRYFTTEVSNLLNRLPNETFGQDLVAIDIQRGRDHGLPGYTKYRETCGLGKVSTFKQLIEANIMPADAVHVLESLYHSVDDIDLFSGGSTELPVKGGLVGPTCGCIIGEQFERSKFGDRFWFENGGQVSSFTPAQLQEINKASIARILCDNGIGVKFMQKHAFIKISDDNPKYSCSSDSIPRLNLSPWKEYTPHFPERI